MDSSSGPQRRRISRRRNMDDAYDINITPVMNLFICLIPFLLISAVFVQLSIIETDAPASSLGEESGKPVSLAMVIIDDSGFTVATFGPIAKAFEGSKSVPKVKGEYNFTAVTNILRALKKIDPEAEDLLIMAGPKTTYETIISVMDAARTTKDGDELFPKAFFGGVTS